MLVRMKKLALAGAVLAAATTLTACGSGSGDYCADLKSYSEDAAGLTAGQANDADQVKEQRANVEKLADEAPDAVKDDWKVLTDLFASVDKIQKEVGLSDEDLAKASSGDTSDLDPKKVTEFGQKASALYGENDLAKAGEAITKHAKDECDVDLNAS
jgi:hypothetical protein